MHVYATKRKTKATNRIWLKTWLSKRSEKIYKEDRRDKSTNLYTLILARFDITK